MAEGNAGLLVVGAGAVGGALAARWAERGLTVRLLDRTAASEAALARRGLLFTGTSGRRRLLRGRFLAARKTAGPASCAFFCVKSQDTAAAARAARPWIGPETAVVALENGLGHERVLRKAFGLSRVVVGVCYFAAERLGPRSVAHNGGRDIHLAADARNAQAVRRAAAALREGGWRVIVDRSEDAMVWTKLCFNAAGNPLGALCGASNGEIVTDPALRDMLLRALDEATAAARAGGHAVSPAPMRRAILRTYPAGSRQRNSMLQDLQRGRRTEIDAIVGPLIEAGRKAGRPAVLLERLSGLIKRLERSS